ncbi:MAG: outer membrane protein assembly factor BamD [Planctomycetes bacterium]|nr:outer membrane protein assembly factor BamD [Planctomycetota bacterium]
MARTSVYSCALAGLLVACVVNQPLPRTPLEFLTAARGALDEDKPNRARYLLEKVDESEFRSDDLVRYQVLYAEALLRSGEPYDAFLAIQKIPTDHPTSPLRPRAEDLQFEAGRRLTASGWNFLGIASDLNDGTAVLRHFVTYWPRSRHIPEALRILGEAAFLVEDYDLAIHRYTQLVQINPSPELTDLAASRIAISHFRKVLGPDYDAGQMLRARKELTGYLERARSPERIEVARKALATILEWEEERGLDVARFYLTIDKPEAAIQRLEALLARAETERRDEAQALLTRARELLTTLTPNDAAKRVDVGETDPGPTTDEGPRSRGIAR